MKILHTADWHLGKKLHKYDLSEDFDLFLDWLSDTIHQRNVDVLVVSGDIFDLANPSSEARGQYYRALMKLRKHDCKIILTGGNHDSPAMLDAPKDLLKELDMHVVGGLPDNLEDVIIPVSGKDGKPALVVAALPYLRDADLRNSSDGHTYDDRLEAIREGIRSTFWRAAEACKDNYPEVPAIALGHLFAAGAASSESERDIQIGNQAAFNALHFGDYFKYIALGHIHKPQKITSTVPTYYSGSPIPLSFSERKDDKRILLLDTDNGWLPESISIPVMRKLIRISGGLEELQDKLENLESSGRLENLLEIELKEENYDANKIYLLDELVTSFQKEGFKIVKHRASFQNQLSGAGELYRNQQLQDLSPRQVFQKLIDNHQYDEDVHLEILSAFDELMEEVQQNEIQVSQ